MKLFLFIFLFMVSISAYALIITEDGRVIFTKDTNSKVFTLLNDSDSTVSLNLSLPSLDEQTVISSCQSWLSVPTGQVELGPYQVHDIEVIVLVPALISANTVFIGQIDFQEATLTHSRKVLLYTGGHSQWQKR